MLGEIAKKSLVQVTYMFTDKGFSGSIRYSKLQFSNPVMEEQRTVYGDWEAVGPKLKEVL